jgi:hypothetical protein
VPSEGGCQCGENRYRITGQLVWLTICHCNECKRQSGSAFGMSLRMLDTDVQLIQGALKRCRSADSGGLGICYFCETCGTRLWHEPAGSGFLHIKPGTLDDPMQVIPRFEGWTKRKVPWIRIEGLEMGFETQRPGRTNQSRTKLAGGTAPARPPSGGL